ncbi:MAG: 23S rRNA (uracil(747)-C(5))-methyltransferase RlmC [Cellulosimicrobium funkei]|uniref:23S rRNA (Uracil(747)-C(5))-methyltransferase n=1 Tax=Cellulosimicrobium cellulans TaxID=1710 RepID=A0AAV5P255_CELCE|nr:MULTISPECIES: 23S rRNA (uracil(747)-C(5))-methyltransferase RlmC [Cellulosimicrobium]KFD44444.1 23S rRNA methyltransferase [Cellulosimicrobium sp. MM]QDP74712.1 23S rRNA (uracil(747)-C(5))-methyltransferase RlmC [Cellulosimicrobium cellulans]GLY55963.1 23S rRNA (uracil(747)-C(5))-methyltransferase [Cellulosimicrobium cellulans]
MQCHHYDAGRCRSCTLLDLAYPAQVTGKQEHCAELLTPLAPDLTWLPTVESAESGFRNKAKMVVTGTTDAPVLGILAEGGGVDLTDCPLYPPALQASFPALAAFVTRARLVPYDVRTRRGELKYVLVTLSPDGDLMARFVLRSTESVPRVRKHLPALLDALPSLRVVSVNLHPEHKAVVEGETEIVLTEAETLRMHVNGIDLHLRPQSFFQTNTDVAAALYRQGRAWVDDAAPATVWDLYCGVGGFALHVAGPGRDVVGVETSAEAVASARLTARDAGLDRTTFLAEDATAFALSRQDVPDLVVVNPPRRGIGESLSTWLERSGVGHVVYSSCNATTLARDLALMPSLRPREARVLDMFPQTSHYEVAVLLERA